VAEDERFGHIWDIIFRLTDVIVCYFILNPISYFIQSAPVPAGPVELFIFYISTDPSKSGLVYGLTIGLKSSIMIFVFIWARASFPRIRFDQLMAFC
jgi:NADH:ubiquinone oxidoreductase subunit H